MRATLAGQGAREALERGGRGAVVAAFRRACYVTVGEELVALVPPEVHPGPVHVILDGPPPRPRHGQAVESARGGLVVAGESIETVDIRPWVGMLPPPASVRSAAETVVRTAAGPADRSSLLADPFRGPASAARELIHEGRLAEAGRVLAGLGPGLTPSGDDALAGIAFALRAIEGPDAEAVATDLAQLVTSGPISRASAIWAARGQALAPAHELLGSAVAGDEAAATSSARALAAVGETSGSDFLLGLVWALSAFAPSGDHPGVVPNRSSTTRR